MVISIWLPFTQCLGSWLISISLMLLLKAWANGLVMSFYLVTNIYMTRKRKGLSSQGHDNTWWLIEAMVGELRERQHVLLKFQINFWVVIKLRDLNIFEFQSTILNYFTIKPNNHLTIKRVLFQINQLFTWKLLIY